jgi:hypothetical protein
MLVKDRIDANRISQFQSFLADTKDMSYNKVTLDQWLSYLDFCLECSDISKFDEASSAWPVLIDDFVDYYNTMKE